jgi:HAD superfamily hydrolase (TIGR01459 family)
MSSEPDVRRPPPVIEHAGELFDRYDILICDIWGVMHDGARAYQPAGEAFARFRAGGGTVLLLSNAPMPSSWVAKVLDEKGVRRDAWDAIVSSGDITLAHIAEQGYGAVHHIGTDRDLPLFETMQVARVGLREADAIVCTGLIDDRNETAENYRSLLEAALGRNLPLVCANPDLIVDVGGDFLPCAGVIAELYEAIGGPVYWAGKPHRPAYERAMQAIARLRGDIPERQRILAVGDAIRTDIAGAAAFGLDAMFVAQGIHRDELLRDGRIDEVALARLLAEAPTQPITTMIGIAW